MNVVNAVVLDAVRGSTFVAAVRIGDPTMAV
jgi:hypothetical protein